jgi:hypothetical protein
MSYELMASMNYFNIWAMWDKNLLFPFVFEKYFLIMVDRGFERRSGQTKDYKLVFVAYPQKHATLNRKSKDWLTRNQDNVSKWSDMLFQ